MNKEKIQIDIIYPCERLFKFYVIEYKDTIPLNWTVDGGSRLFNYLDKIYSQWNLGSKHESKLFMAQKCRSMSPGDFVKLRGKWFQCSLVGWKLVDWDYICDFTLKIREKIEKNADMHPFRASTELMYFEDNELIKGIS